MLSGMKRLFPLIDQQNINIISSSTVWCNRIIVLGCYSFRIYRILEMLTAGYITSYNNQTKECLDRLYWAVPCRHFFCEGIGLATYVCQRKLFISLVLMSSASALKLSLTLPYWHIACFI